MKERLHLIWQAILGKPILWGLNFIKPPYFKSQDLFVGNSTFPIDTIFDMLELNRLNVPINTLNAKYCREANKEFKELKIKNCYAIGEGQSGLE